VRPIRSSLFEGIPDALHAELTQRLAGRVGVRIERIVSRGHASPEGFWYDQGETEWVLLVRGAAKLRFEGEDELVEMAPGDYLTIPARARHRVEWTAPNQETVWLAVFY
jgi:cupin 2 domain-containing protein